MVRVREDQVAAGGDAGFSLIELLAVVVIIGVLAGIAIPALVDRRESAWKGAVESDLRNVAVAVEGFSAQHGGYPSVSQAGTILTLTGSGSTPPTTTVQLSEQVEIRSGAAAVETFCLVGDHDDLSASPVAVFDSDDGGLDAAC